jgi:hypothetical protein
MAVHGSHELPVRARTSRIASVSVRRTDGPHDVLFLLYGRHFQPTGGLRVALVVGATRHDERYEGLQCTYGGLAATFGGDAEIAVTPHLSFVSGLRVHNYLPYGDGNSGSITRPRVALRWCF